MNTSPRIPALLSALALLLPAAGLTQNFKVTRFSIGGAGGTDYLTAEPGTGRVFVTRGTHVMVVDGTSGQVLGDMLGTSGVHGVALVPKWNHGFTTNREDATLTMFNLKTTEVIRKITIPSQGLDGIYYDDITDRIILSNHGRPKGAAMAVDPGTGELLGTTGVEDGSPEGVTSDGHGKLYINNEGAGTVQVIDARAMRVEASWPLRPCAGPTGIAFDRIATRLIVGCSRTSVVLDPTTGKVVATIANGEGVDALGWDPVDKLIYIPNGRDGTVTIVHQDTPDKYRVIATLTTMAGAKTISVDPIRHVAYLFQPEYGPAPAPASDAPAPSPGSRWPHGPLIGAYLLAITH
jgi:hypothetical protein